MNPFRQDNHKLIWQKNHEMVQIEAWGADSLRVRATREACIQDLPGALLAPKPCTPVIEIEDSGASITNGKLKAEVLADGHLRFTRSETGRVLLEEEPLDFTYPPARDFRTRFGGLWHVEVKFLPQEGERFYGLGQRNHGLLDQKGCVLELTQRNTHVNIPFTVSNKGYGFLWHNPAVGRVELGKNMTRWVAESTRQVDYYLTAADTPAQIMANYADATGHAPLLPEWAAGFWQCKLRYRTQDELIAVAREYKRRGLPLDIIVIDFFHWTFMGDWKFKPQEWQDPTAMVKELDKLGVKVMVSVWATVNHNSENYPEMQARGLLLNTERGLPAHFEMRDGGYPVTTAAQYYDPTNPEARQFVWERIKETYYRYGIKTYWLDAPEPEFHNYEVDNLRYHIGNGLEVSNLYPLLHEQGFYENMKAEGETEIINLCRSAWAGSQRYAAAVWSGDILSKFEVLRSQVRAGLNIAMSGIPWWTTDIGGFREGNITTPYFRELIVRWFQYGVFCPLFRLHGCRAPMETFYDTGAENEVWSFGEEAYAIIKDLLFLRERMKPYIMAQMSLASEVGTPPMRPLFFDFPQDETCYKVDDQFMLGPDILVAPVLYEGQRARRLYLPHGCDWQDAWDGKPYSGGRWISVDAPLAKVPVFIRSGSKPF